MDQLYRTVVVDECNEALARLRGFGSAEQLRGVAVRELFHVSEPKNLELVRNFLRSGYRILDGESLEKDEYGHQRYFLNNVTGVDEKEVVFRIWVTKREGSEQRR